MSGPAGGALPGCRAGGEPAERAAALAVRVFAGCPGQVGRARAWAGGQLAAVCPALAGDAALVTTELAANSIIHTRSGQPGGTFTVVVAAPAAGGVLVHVHDQGTGSDQLPHLRSAVGRDELAGGGRGLVIVAALSTAWGAIPAACCPASPSGGPAAAGGGCCTWCHLPMPHEAPAPLVHTPGPGAGARLAGPGGPGGGRDPG